MSASPLIRHSAVYFVSAVACCLEAPALSADAARSNPVPRIANQPTTEKLLQDLVSGDRAAWDSAIRNLGKRKSALPALSRLAVDRTKSNRARWGAVLALARIKDPKTTDLFITLLKDDYQVIRGTASWGLSQIGGKRAANALLGYLRWSVEKQKGSDIIRATEAQVELPDKRALPLLLKCLERRHDPYGYVGEALGKLGDPSASELLAKQLRVDEGYAHSRDYLYLKAIKATRGAKAAPLLVQYLRDLVAKMKGQSIQTLRKLPGGPRGRENRQIAMNFGNFHRTISALEAVSGKKSISGTRQEVFKFWSKWLRTEYKAE